MIPFTTLLTTIIHPSYRYSVLKELFFFFFLFPKNLWDGGVHHSHFTRHMVRAARKMMRILHACGFGHFIIIIVIINFFFFVKWNSMKKTLMAWYSWIKVYTLLLELETNLILQLLMHVSIYLPMSFTRCSRFR